MATRAEILARAKEIIENNPTAGKRRINEMLRAEFGVGLRSSAVLELKAEVATERPRLIPQLYRVGGVTRSLNDIYKGWRDAGFLPFEARELTVGHGDRYKAFDARAIFNSQPGRAARRTRSEMILQQLSTGWTKKQIRDNIIDFYRKSKRVDPWELIRAEYKPRLKVDYIDYRDKVRKRAKAKQKRLERTKPPTASRSEWIAQLRENMNKATTPQQRARFRQQIINLGGKP